MKNITKATLDRLPIYLRYLKSIKSISQIISAIWSFAGCELIVPENVVLLQEKLELSLAHLHNKLRRD